MIIRSLVRFLQRSSLIMEQMTPYKFADGRTLDFIKVGDYTVPASVVKRVIAGQNVKGQLQVIKHLEMKSDDVIICAYMKAGTHWLWEIVSMLVNNSVEYMQKSKEVAMLEFLTADEVANIPSPRVLNSHVSVKDLPTQCLEKRCKVIHIMRNPKDLIVSLYHHQNKMPGCTHVEDLPSFLRIFTGEAGCCMGYPWDKYEQEWDQFSKSSPGYPVLNMYFEDLKQEPEKEIEKVARFLELDVSKEFIQEVSDKCSFTNLKKVSESDMKDDKSKKFTADGTSFFFRKGQIGDWKNHLTVADNEKLDKWLEEKTKNIPWRFQYLSS